jgi:protein O-GlcNAc transferase
MNGTARLLFAGFFVAYLQVATPQTRDDELAITAQRAKQAEAAGDYQTAIREYKSLVRRLSNNPQVRTNLGIALYLGKDPAAALSELQAASRLSPNLFPAHLFAGLAAYQLGEFEQAKDQLLRAVELDGADPLPHLWLGYTYTAEEKYDLVVDQMTSGPLSTNGDPDALYLLGHAYLCLGRQAAEQLVRIAPDGGRAWQLVAEQCRLRGDSSKALHFYQGAYERRPDLVELRDAINSLNGAATATEHPQAPVDAEDQLFRKAHQYESLSQATFNRLGRIAPESYRAHQILGDASASAGRSEEAIREYRIVLDLKPDLYSIHGSIGTEYLRLGKVREAAQQFQAEVTLQPNSATAHLNLARALLLLAKDEEAQKHLLLAVQSKNPPPGVYKLLGKSRLEHHRFQEAAQALERYLVMMPGDSAAHYLLSRAYRSLNQDEAARRELDRSRQVSPDARSRNSAQRALAEMFAPDMPQ